MNSSEILKEISSSKKIVMGNVLLLLASLLFSFLMGEVGVRFWVLAWPFQQDQKELSYLTEKDTNLRWRFSSQNGRNSLGLRNIEVTQKGEDVFRIMFLGDSLIWSGATSSGKLYTQVIEDSLNEALNVDKTIEVINAGIPGYTTYQELEFLNVYGFDMQPDLVILGFVFNDVYYKYLHRPTKDKFFAPETGARLHRFNGDSFLGKLFSGSYLVHEVVYVIQRIVKKIDAAPYYSFEHRQDFYLAWKSYGWANTRILIDKMQKQLSDRGITLAILIFPVSEQLGNKYLSKNRDYVLYPQRRIKEISEMNGIPYIDLTDALYQGGGSELFSDYLHLKPEGNDIVATELTRYLSSSFHTYLVN